MEKFNKWNEKKDQINIGLYGGRNGCEANAVSLLEELKTDISYSTRKSLTLFDNDAAACYDWIVPNLSSLIAQKYEMDKIWQPFTQQH